MFSVTMISPVTSSFPLRVWATCALLLAVFSLPIHAQLEPVDAEQPISINLAGDSAGQVLSLIELITGKSVIRAQNLPAVKITFNSYGPISRAEALVALESLLSINGIALTPIGEKFIKAVTFQDVVRQVPEYLQVDPRDLPASEKFYTMMVRLQYLNVAANEHQNILEPIMSPSPIGKIVNLPKANALLLTDTLLNLQRVQSVLQTADEPHAIEDQVYFFQLKNMQARELQSRLQSMLLNQNSSLSKYFIGNTTLESDERTNQLVVLTHPSNEELLRKIIDSFDIEVDPQTSSEVFYIKHAQAIEVEAVLEEVITGQQKTREDEPDTLQQDTPNINQTADVPPAGSNNLPTPPGGTPGTSAPRPGSDGVDSDNLQFSQFITIVADERSNAIIVYGTKTDIKQVSALIDKIDVVLAQVMIEVVIAEVTLEEDEVSGLNALGIKREGSGIGGISFNTQTPSIGDDPAFSINTTLDLKEFTVAFGPAVSKGKVRILQAPVIATTHNQEATINVSQSQPFITGSATSTINTDSVTNTVQYRDVGIQLTVKPLIGSNGIVQMEIEQIVENTTGSNVEVNGTEQPIIAKREATSFVSVSDQEIIVLAGLQESKVNRTDQKVFLLGDIPIFGEIFNSERDDNTRRELMLFIKPTVIYTQTDATRVADKTLEYLDNGEQARKFLTTPDMSVIFDEETAEPPLRDLRTPTKQYGPAKSR